MIKYFNTLANERGDVLPNYRLQVVTSAGAIVPIYADKSGTQFTDASGNPVNYATAGANGRVRFYWTPATGQILQTLDVAGDLVDAEADFADSNVLDVLPGELPQSSVTSLVDDLAAKASQSALDATNASVATKANQSALDATDATVASNTAAIATKADDAATTAALATKAEEKETFPTGFNWNSASYPVNIYRRGGSYYTDYDPFVNINTAVSDVTYWVAEDGDNANAGTTEAAPVRSIWKAADLLQANGSAAGGTIRVKAPTDLTAFGRQHAFGDPSAIGGTANRRPTKHVRLVGVGGPVPMGSFDANDSISYTWVVDGTDPAVYTCTRSASNRVYDMTVKDAKGKPFRYRRVADIAAVRASKGGTFCVTGSSVSVKRFDGTKPTHANAIILLDVTGFRTPSAYDLVMENFELWGGAQGCFEDNYDGLQTCDRVLKNVDLIDGAQVGAGRNTLTVADRTGLFYMENVRSFYGPKDAFNFNSASGDQYVLSVNCRAMGMGEGTNASCNAYTLHDDVVAIDIEGDYYDSHGGCVRNIGTTQMWALGTKSGPDNGDILLGGSTVPTCFQMEVSAKLWAQDTEARGGGRSYIPSTGTTIYGRRVKDGGGVRTPAGGTFTSF